MDISIHSRQKRNFVFQAVIFILFLFLIIHNNRNRLRDLTNQISFTNPQLYDERSNVQQYNGNLKKRLPDVIIVGVKKSGTMTLAKFLNYHPSIAGAGEISFFEKG